MKSLGDIMEWPFIFLLAAIIGPISGLVSLYIGSMLIKWTGSWLDGKASLQNIRAAMAWASVPVIWALILWVPELALFGQELFTTQIPIIDANPYLALILLGFGLVEITIGIWAIVVFLKCLGQVQGFSAWKSLGNVFLAMLIIIIPFIAIGFIIGSLI